MRVSRPGAATIVSAPFSSTHGARLVRAGLRRIEPACVDPGRIAAEQARELARVRREHGRRLAGEDPVQMAGQRPQTVGVEDDGQLEALEQEPDELTRSVAAAEARARAPPRRARPASSTIAVGGLGREPPVRRRRCPAAP